MTEADHEVHEDRRVEALLDAARAVEHWYYERDAMWVELTASERQEADQAVIALHESLVALGESGAIDDADPDASSITEILEGIPDLPQRLTKADIEVRAGNATELEEL